jgi:hypothetical protein
MKSDAWFPSPPAGGPRRWAPSSALRSEGCSTCSGGQPRSWCQRRKQFGGGCPELIQAVCRCRRPMGMYGARCGQSPGAGGGRDRGRGVVPRGGGPLRGWARRARSAGGRWCARRARSRPRRRAKIDAPRASRRSRTKKTLDRIAIGVLNSGAGGVSSTSPAKRRKRLCSSRRGHR